MLRELTLQNFNNPQQSMAILRKKHFVIAKAVLVAIAIPVFTNQLEKSREATDASNIRAAYAEIAASALTDPDTAKSAIITKKQTQADWISPLDIAGVSTDDIAGGPGTIVVEYGGATDPTIKIDGNEVKTRFIS